MSDVKSKFEAALAQRKKQKAEEATRGNFTGGSGFPDIPYSPLYSNKQQAFRFVGLPYLVREKSTDSKRIHVSMILGDDDKKFRCIGPDPQEQKDWILYRVINKVLTKHWDKSLPGPNGGAYAYDYAAIHPELFNRVAKNNNTENTLERGWKFNAYILFNVIDRANYAWHLENKKYRVLSKKASEWQDKVFFEPGVPDTVFQMIMDNIVAYDGNTNWEDYDIVISKFKDKPWYQVLHGLDDVKKLDEDVKALVVNKGLSDAEMSWELNDFDKLFSVTRYARIKSKLGLFFQKVDKIFNTKYYEELCALVEKEEIEEADKKTKFLSDDEDDVSVPQGVIGSETESQVSVTPIVTASQPVAPSQPQSPPVRTPASVVQEYAPMTDAVWAGLADGSYNGKTYKGVPLMKDHERALVLGVRSDGSFEWSPAAGELFEGSRSKFLAPEAVHVDPLDGSVFQA